MNKEFNIGDIVEMKKKHPCGSYQWKIYRMGMDFGISCVECNRKVMIPRKKFERSVKKIVKTSEE